MILAATKCEEENGTEFLVVITWREQFKQMAFMCTIGLNKLQNVLLETVFVSSRKFKN